MFPYGFGFYKHGVWFGIGQVQFRCWAVDICLLKRSSGYNRYWLTVGW